MKKKIASIFLSFAMVLSCLFALTACGGKKDKDPVIESISVELVSTSYAMKNNTISVVYGSKVELGSSDFKVTANYNDETTKTVALKTDTVDGYTFSSTLPNDDVTAAGEYKLTFSYAEKQAEVKVNVNKAAIDMTDVKWNYTLGSFTYDGTEKTVEILADTLPEGVTVSYQNNAKTNAGEYTATASFAYADTTNFEQIDSMTIEWEIEKATYDMSNVQITTGYVYRGTEYTAELYNLPEGVTAVAIDDANIQTNAGEYDVEFRFEGDAENYNAIPNKTYKFVINKGIAQGKTQRTFVYDGDPKTLEAEDIILPTGIKLESISNNTQTDNGNYQAALSVSYNDVALQNYEEVETIYVAWKIDRARYDMSGISWDYDASSPYSYTGLEQSVVLTGELPEGVTPVYSNNVKTGAGDYVATVEFNYDTVHYYKPTIENLYWQIKRVKLTIKAKDTTITFGEEATNSGVECTGFVNNETLDDLSGILSFTYSGYMPGSAVDGTYYISPKGLKSDNYQITFSPGRLIVEKATIDVEKASWDYEKDFNYNGSVQAPVLKGIPSGVEVNYIYKLNDDIIVANPTNAGTYTATATFGASNNNYDIVNADSLEVLNWKINKVSLTITADNKDVRYYENAPIFSVSYSGFVNGENSTVLKGEIDFECDYVVGDNVGTTHDIIISNSEISADNYEISYVKGTLTVIKALMDVSGATWNYSSAYTYTGVAQTPKLTGLPAGFSATYTYKLGNAEESPVNAGEYIAIANITGTDNYDVSGSVADLTFVINAVPVVITVKDFTISYYEKASNDGWTVVGLVNNESESVLGNLQATYGGYALGSNKGEYVLSVTGYNNLNYQVSVVPATLYVEPAEVSVGFATWDYDAAKPYTYKDTVQVPQIASGIENFVEFTYVYTLEDGSVIQNPKNAGNYVASVEFTKNDNYVINGEVLECRFVIQKATVNEDFLHWNLGDVETASGYFGEDHYIYFVNETGVDLNIEYVGSNDPQENPPTMTGIYVYTVQISFKAEDEPNYNELTKTIYTLEYEVKDYFEDYTATFLIAGEEKEITYSENNYSGYNVQNAVLTGLEFNFVEGVEGYRAEFYADVNLTNSVDYNNINELENNTIYVAVYKDGSLLEIREDLKVNLSYNALFVETGVVENEQDRYKQTASISVDTKPVSVEIRASSVNVQISDFANATIEVAIYDKTNQTYGNYENYSSEKAITLTSDIIDAKVRVTIVYNENTYVYEKAITIVPYVNSDDYLTVSYLSSENGEVESSENMLQLNNLDVNTVKQLDPQSIQVETKTQENGTTYIELTENREIIESNGNYFLKVVLEAQSNDSVTLYSEAEDITNQIVCYIKLVIQGTIDSNVSAKITAKSVDYYEKMIYVSVGDLITVETKNPHAKIEVYSEASPDPIFNAIGIMTYQFTTPEHYYILITATDETTSIVYDVNVSYSQGGGNEGGYPGYDQGDPTDTSYYVSAHDVFGNWINKDGEIVSDFEEYEYPYIEVEEGNSVDTLTLSNWNETKYINIWGNSGCSQVVIGLVTDTNGDGNDGDNISENEIEVIEGPIYHANYNFRQAGIYYVCIISGDQQSTRLLIITVEGEFKPFMQITANGETYTENIDEDFNTSGDFIWWQNILEFAESENSNESVVGGSDGVDEGSGDLGEDSETVTEYPNSKENFEIYVGEVESLGANYQISILTAFEDYLYNIDSETGLIDKDSKLSVVDGKLTLQVLGDEIKFVSFVVSYIDKQPTAIASDYYVWVYFCDKSDRLSYHTLTVGDDSFDVKLDISRYGDFGDILVDYYTGLSYIVVNEDDLESDGSVKMKFQTYSGYTLPENAYDYLILTEEGLMTLGSSSFTTYEEFGSVVSLLIDEKLAFRSTTMEIGLELNAYGFTTIYVFPECSTEEMFEMFEYMIVPIQIRVEEFYTETDYDYDSENGMVLGGDSV